tara:strand:- start:5319 stop:5687 length:369 start_codon:yes stop_codon:yes gene_type:complete
MGVLKYNWTAKASGNFKWELEKYKLEQYERTVHKYQLEKDLNTYKNSIMYLVNGDMKIIGRDIFDYLPEVIITKILKYIPMFSRYKTVDYLLNRKKLYKLPEPDPEWLYERTIDEMEFSYVQ